MKIDFDDALEDCAGRIASGESSLDECLTRYPEYAARLKPLLQAAVRVERGRRIIPSATFKARARAQLTAHMQAHPRRRSWTDMFSLSPVRQLGTALAVLILAFLLTGTAFAQNALPGQPLYSWKLSSEQAWRAVSFDRVGVDLVLADRRAYEITVETSDAGRQAEAVQGYQEVLSRLTSENDAQNNDRIVKTLQSHQEKFSAAGVSVPDLESLLSSTPSLPPAISATRPSPAEATDTPVPGATHGPGSGFIPTKPAPALPALLPTQAHGVVPTSHVPVNNP